MKIYWYAPFDNAREVALAPAVVRDGDELTFHSRVAHPERDLPEHIPGCVVRRDLPETPGDDGRSRSVLRRAGVAVSRARRRDRLVASERFDLAHLHTYNPFTDPIGLRLLRRRVGRVVVSVHNVRPHDRHRFRGSAGTRLLAAGYRVAPMLLVAHSSLRDLLINDFGISARRVHVVPLPIPAIELAGDQARAGSYLFFGTFRPNKGLNVLLDSMRLIGDESIRLHIAGRGDPDLERLVGAAAAADPRITAEIGYVSARRLDTLMRTTSCVVLPYTRFGAQSGVLGDAYSYHRPVIASNVGALGHDVLLHRTGRVVQPNEAEELAHAIASLDCDSDEWRDFSQAAEKVAAERTVSSIGRKIRALYDIDAEGA